MVDRERPVRDRTAGKHSSRSSPSRSDGEMLRFPCGLMLMASASIGLTPCEVLTLAGSRLITHLSRCTQYRCATPFARSVDRSPRCSNSWVETIPSHTSSDLLRGSQCLTPDTWLRQVGGIGCWGRDRLCFSNFVALSVPAAVVGSRDRHMVGHLKCWWAQRCPDETCGIS